MSDESVSRRCDQIAWTAHRVLPAEVGKWEVWRGPILAAESVVIAPADLMWLIEAAKRGPTYPPGSSRPDGDR